VSRPPIGESGSASGCNCLCDSTEHFGLSSFRSSDNQH